MTKAKVPRCYVCRYKCTYGWLHGRVYNQVTKKTYDYTVCSRPCFFEYCLKKEGKKYLEDIILEAKILLEPLDNNVPNVSN